MNVNSIRQSGDNTKLIRINLVAVSDHKIG